MPVSRRVSEILSFVQRSPHFRFWPIAAFTGNLLPGDIFFSFEGGHGHAAIVIREGSLSEDIHIIHLPGSSQLIAQGRYDPRVLNDIRVDTWWNRRGRYGVARYIG